MEYSAQRRNEGSLVTLLVVGLCLSIFIVDPLVNELRILPYVFSWLPELFSAAATLLIVIFLAGSGRLMIRPVYVALFFLFLAVLIAGWVFNDVNGWTVVAGVRVYFRYVPFFLLPIVLAVSDADINRQLRFMAMVWVLQFPMVVLQKWILNYPPDHITGMAMIGSTLSFLLIAGLGLVLTLYLKGHLSLRQTIVLGFLFFFPTTVNETKGTLVLLPICLAAIYFLARENSQRKVSPLVALGSMAGLIGLFFVIYSATLPDNWGEGSASKRSGLIAFFTDPEQGVVRYLYSGDAHVVNAEAILQEDSLAVVGALSDPGIIEGRMRRLDSAMLPYYILKHKPVRLAVGLGAANTSDFSIGAATGHYAHIWRHISAEVSATTISLELGYLGLGVFVVFLILIFQDSVRLSRSKNWDSVLGCWWAGVVLMFLLALVYKDFIKFNAIGFLFWYFSGLVVARSYLFQVAPRVHPAVQGAPMTMILASENTS